MKRLSKKPVAIIMLLAAIVVVGACLILFLGQDQSQKNPASSATTGPKGFLYENQWYDFRDDLKTILIMGLDKYERPDDTIGYINNQQADFIALLVIDEAAGECSILHLNRDTMAEIPRLGVVSDGTNTFTGQLALAHTFGSGGSDSCRNAVKAVSKFLCGVKIDHYITMTMDGIEKLTDLVGGVKLTVLDDLSSVDAVLVQGKEIVLNGSQARAYIRSQMEMEDSNLHCMERQRQFMNALYQKLHAYADNEFYAKALLSLSGNIQSNCSASQLKEMSTLLKKCSLNEISPLHGEEIKTENFLEFYVDETSLKETVISLFCQQGS